MKRIGSFPSFGDVERRIEGQIMRVRLLTCVWACFLLLLVSSAVADEAPFRLKEAVASRNAITVSTKIDMVSKGVIEVAGRQRLGTGTVFSETVLNNEGQLVNGAHDLILSYFVPGGVEPIWVEQLSRVEFLDCRFDVFLGAGIARIKNEYGSLLNVFAAQPELEMEVRVDGMLQAPRVGILPAGHSPETRAVLSGAFSNDDELHTKGYRTKSESTSVQAVTLRPSHGKSVGAVDSSSDFKTSPFLIDTIFLGISGPVRDMPTVGNGRETPARNEGREVNPPRHENLFDDDGYRFGTRTVKIDDPLAVQSERGSGRASPSLLVAFEGIGFTNVAPPDIEGAVGINHYVQVINSKFAIWTKAGALVNAAVNTNSLWSGFGGLCESDNSGDAVFLYDEPADRWVFTQFTSGNVVCFAVSTTDDPTGTFALYQVNTQKFPDYYKLGVWPDADNNAYFMGTNTGYAGDYDIYAIDRANMLTGSAARQAQYFQNHPNLLMPADLDGDNLPPTGQPGIFFTFRDGGESYFQPQSAVDTLDIWEFDVDWNTPANSTFGIVQQIQPPELTDFNWTICGFFQSDCLSQPGTTQKIDSASWWPMQRLQYRNFGNYEAMVSSWTVDTLSSGDHAAPRWFELQRPTPSANWSMAHEGTLSPDTSHRWMPSVALDGSGNMAIGFSIVDATATIYPSIRYATRAAGNAAFDAEATMIAGGGSETSVNRWGDYASMEVDPVDDCTFWFTSEYIKTTGGWNWSTYVGAFKVPSCTGSTCDAVAPTGASAVANGANRIDVSWSAATGATQYWIYRSQTSGGPYSQVGTVSAPTTSYSDTSVSGNVTYYYVVRTYTTCESGFSSEASATATGTCTEPPLFAGITSATNGSIDNPCTINLTWDPATLYCAGPLTYRVYRDTTSGFVPGGGNQIATGVSCSGSPCSYADIDTLLSGTPYYYVVRAYDASTATEESNTAEATATPSGSTLVPQQVYFDDFDSNRPADPGDFWMEGNFGGTTSEEWHMPETNRSYSTTNAYKWGGNGSANYADDQDAGLIFGGDGSGPSGANGFAFGAGSQNLRMTFWHTYDAEASWDGCYLMYSTDSAVSGYLPVPDTVAAGSPYIISGAYTGTISSGSTEVWNGNYLGSWSKVEVNLDSLAGSTGWFAWRCPSDGSINREGYYLDDVGISGELPGGCTTGGSCTDPGAPSITSITDDNNCAQSGVTINFTGGSGAASHDLWVDSAQAVVGFTTGSSYNPGDSGSHSYVIRAIDSTCFTDSASSSFTDADATVGTPAAPSVSDDDVCVQDGVTITWGGVSNATGYDLRVDGGVAFSASSPYSYNPGDSASHNYEVRGTNATCGAGAWSPVTAAIDEEGAPGTPGAPAVVDVSSCALTGVQITWGAVSGATSYDLQVDGTSTVIGVSSPHTYTPGNSTSHTYQVRAVNVCGNGTWSTGTAGIDGDHSFSWVGIDTAADRDACDDTGVAIRWSTPANWNDGGTGSRSFTVLRDAGTLTSGIAETTLGIDDTSGVNGTSYNYALDAINGYGCSAGGSATQAASDEVGSAPTFGGLQSVTAMPGGVCGLRLEWNVGTSNCGNGPAIVYNVYKSTTSGFTPDGTNLLESCVADLYYEDHTVIGGTNYYYVVRAEDSSLGHGGPCNNGFTDTNTNELSGIVSAGASTQTVYFDDFDGGVTPADYWNIGYSFGNPYASAPCDSETMADDWHLPQAGFCSGNTAASNDGVSPYDYSDPGNGALILGDTPVGGGPPFSDGGIVLPATATSVTLTFNHDYDLENGWDGGRLMISVDDWPTFSTITPVGGYPGTTNSSTSYCHPWPGIDAYTGDSAGCVSAEFDLSAYAGQRIWLAWNMGTDNWNTSDDGWMIDDVLIEAAVPGSACSTAPSPVQHLTARSTNATVKLEWENPAAPYGSTRICVDTSAFPTDPATCTVLVDQVGAAGAYDSYSYSGLTNNNTYYYAAFVDSGSGEFSSRQTVAARPFDNSGKTKWSYHSSASALAPPGLYPGAAGTGAAYGVSNDRVLHGFNATAAGGDWPRTAPFDWMPMGMNGPAQDRPPIVAMTVGAADLVAFLGSQDGHVYAANAKTGETLWQSASNYGLVQGSPAGMFTGFGGAYEVLFAGSRVAGSGNSMYGINPATGANLWTFGGTIGIISSAATVDYANSRIYFSSRENSGGSNHTLWCLSVTDSGASLVWSNPMGDIDSAPVLYDGVLYVGTNAGTVVALDPNTGAKIWRYETHDGGIKGFVDFEFVAVPRQLFFATSTSVWSLLDSGSSVSLEWQQNTIAGPSIPLTLATQGEMYVGSTDGKLHQLDTSNGNIVTSLAMGAGTATVGSPGYDWMNSLAYVGAEDGSVYAVTLPLQ